jgi:hypothetical protein
VNFLAPFYLVLAAAAGVPLLLHLMRRNVGARVEFPAARYLRRAEQEHSRSLRLRNLLLMLLRVALVVVLALAAARPFISGIGVGHGPVAAAIVLDNSLSTTAVAGGAPIFDRLRDAATALVGATTPADHLWLVTADGRVRGGDRAHLLAELQRVVPLEGAGDLTLALRRALAVVQENGDPNKTIAIATDGQQTSWSTAVRVATPVAVYVPPGDPPLNRAVIAADAEPPRWTPRGAVVGRVDSRDSVGYRILLGERTLARGTTGRGAPILVHASPPERGWQAGRIELEPDDFRADDVRHFAVWVGAPPAVTVDPGAGAFATTAIASLVADGRATAGQGVRIASADVAGALPALLLPPSDPVRLGAANRALARLGIPWRFGPLQRRPAIARGARLEGITVAERYTLVHEGAGVSDTLGTAGGEPWIVAGAGYVLAASRFDPAATSLPIRAPFVPWLGDVLSVRLAGTAGEIGAPLAAVPGASVRLPEGADGLEAVSGARRAVTGALIDAPEERGVWFILRRGHRIGALVVNAPIGESALARWSAGALANRLGGRAARAATSADAWVRDALATGASRPALAPLLLVALVLLAAEALVLRTGRTSRSTAA